MTEVQELLAAEFALMGEGCSHGPKGCSLEIAAQLDPCLERANQKLLGAPSH